MSVDTAELNNTNPMEANQYHSQHALSNSGMKDLAVSPLRYWHLHLSPDRPAERITPELTFGTALHCKVLEPDEFGERFACEIDIGDFPGCLRTKDDLSAWLKSHGQAVSGNKPELIDRISRIDASVPIWDVLVERYAVLTEGKVQLSKEDWLRVESANNALLAEPRLVEILKEPGEFEASLFVTDPETGVRLKARMDWVTPKTILDLKTFSQTRGKSIDKTVTDAIWYEAYYRQAYFYSLVHALHAGDKSISGPQKAPEFVLAFVESDAPHEVRIRSLRPRVAGEVNLLWEHARREVRGLIRLYADFMNRYGDKPWRSARDIDPLQNEEFPQLMYA